mmetsp:Transcript_19006/g.52772  ORF Transcript_19006/g.52772 Transcript_19006/m.52772 type:complete len:115 (-) Transcript_19006:19-363(-)
MHRGGGVAIGPGVGSQAISVGAAAAAAAKDSQLYEVLYDAVWIRRSPSTQAEAVTKRLKGDVLSVLELEETSSGVWGRVHVATAEGQCEGWMLLRHPDLGELLRPVVQAETVLG